MNKSIEQLLNIIEENKEKLRDCDYKGALEHLQQINIDFDRTAYYQLKILRIIPKIAKDIQTGEYDIEIL